MIQNEEVQAKMALMPSPAEMERNRTCDSIRTSMERIYSSIESVRRGDTSPLTKADLDNAIRHAAHLGKQLRAIKQSLFPMAPKKTTNGTATPKTEQGTALT